MLLYALLLRRPPDEQICMDLPSESLHRFLTTHAALLLTPSLLVELLTDPRQLFDNDRVQSPSPQQQLQSVAGSSSLEEGQSIIFQASMELTSSAPSSPFLIYTLEMESLPLPLAYVVLCAQQYLKSYFVVTIVMEHLSTLTTIPDPMCPVPNRQTEGTIYQMHA